MFCGNSWEHDWGASAGSSTKQSHPKNKTCSFSLQTFLILGYFQHPQQQHSWWCDGLWWFQTSPGFGFPKNKCDFEDWPYLESADTETMTAPINDSDTAQVPWTTWTTPAPTHRELNRPRVCRKDSSQDIHWITPRAFPVWEFCIEQFTKSKWFMKKLGISDWEQDLNILSCVSWLRKKFPAQ